MRYGHPKPVKEHKVVNDLCFECGDKATENAHIVPKIRGGTKTIPLCGKCHGLAHGMNRSNDIGALTREGLDKARQKGVVLGAPVKMPLDISQRIVREYQLGKSLSGIARTLNNEAISTTHNQGIWYASTIRAALIRLGAHRG